MKWNFDMDAAPRDGTWILVYEEGDWQPNIHVARWAESQPWFQRDTQRWVTIALGPNPDTYDPNPTAWMPLPAPPKET